MRLKNIGDHDCPVPTPDTDDDQDFTADHEWECPDCKSRWVVQTHSDRLPLKFRISNSSTKWKRAQYKRLVNEQ